MSNSPLKHFAVKHYAPATACAYDPNVSTGACNGPNIGTAGVRFTQPNRHANNHGDPKHPGYGPLRLSKALAQRQYISRRTWPVAAVAVSLASPTLWSWACCRHEREDEKQRRA